MGKKARSRAQRRASTRPRQRATTASKPAESRAIVAAAAQLLDALDTYGRAVHEHREDLDVLALPDQFAICAEYALSGAALVDVQNLQLAWQIVDSNDPVLGALPTASSEHMSRTAAGGAPSPRKSSSGAPTSTRTKTTPRILGPTVSIWPRTRSISTPWTAHAIPARSCGAGDRPSQGPPAVPTWSTCRLGRVPSTPTTHAGRT